MRRRVASSHLPERTTARVAHLGTTTPDFHRFWAKARPASDGPSWHSVAHHLLDVAAVAEAILRVRPIVARRASALLRLEPDDARTLIVALAALHDLGKFAPVFQAKAPDHWPADVLGPYRELAVRRPHTEDGYALWRDVLADRVAERLWPDGREALDALAPGIFGHHGRPMGRGIGFDERARTRFGEAGLRAALACADSILRLIVPAPLPTCEIGEDAARLASWWVAGLITVADWVGSNQGWFPYAGASDDEPALDR